MAKKSTKKPPKTVARRPVSKRSIKAKPPAVKPAAKPVAAPAAAKIAPALVQPPKPQPLPPAPAPSIAQAIKPKPTEGPIQKERHYRPDEIAKIFRVSISYVYYLVRKNKIKVVRIGRLIRIPSEEYSRLCGEGS